MRKIIMRRKVLLEGKYLFGKGKSYEKEERCHEKEILKLSQNKKGQKFF